MSCKNHNLLTRFFSSGKGGGGELTRSAYLKGESSSFSGVIVTWRVPENLSTAGVYRLVNLSIASVPPETLSCARVPENLTTASVPPENLSTATVPPENPSLASLPPDVFSIARVDLKICQLQVYQLRICHLQVNLMRTWQLQVYCTVKYHRSICQLQV